jgi:hypothetical protein
MSEKYMGKRHIGGTCRIECLWGVNIPWWLVTSAVKPVSRPWMRNDPPSKSVCQERPNHWYKKCQTAFGKVKVYNSRSNHFDSHRTWGILTLNKTIESSATSVCASVVYPNWKTDRMQNRPLQINSLRDTNVIAICRLYWAVVGYEL